MFWGSVNSTCCGEGRAPDMEWVQMDTADALERKFMCLLDGDHWKAQQNSEQDEGSSGDDTIPRVKLSRIGMMVGVLNTFLGTV